MDALTSLDCFDWTTQQLQDELKQLRQHGADSRPQQLLLQQLEQELQERLQLEEISRALASACTALHQEDPWDTLHTQPSQLMEQLVHPPKQQQQQQQGKACAPPVQPPPADDNHACTLASSCGAHISPVLTPQPLTGSSSSSSSSGYACRGPQPLQSEVPGPQALPLSSSRLSGGRDAPPCSPPEGKPPPATAAATTAAAVVAGPMRPTRAAPAAPAQPMPVAAAAHAREAARAAFLAEQQRLAQARQALASSKVAPARLKQPGPVSPAGHKQRSSPTHKLPAVTLPGPRPRDQAAGQPWTPPPAAAAGAAGIGGGKGGGTQAAAYSRGGQSAGADSKTGAAGQMAGRDQGSPAAAAAAATEEAGRVQATASVVVLANTAVEQSPGGAPPATADGAAKGVADRGPVDTNHIPGPLMGQQQQQQLQRLKGDRAAARQRDKVPGSRNDVTCPLGSHGSNPGDPRDHGEPWNAVPRPCNSTAGSDDTRRATTAAVATDAAMEFHEQQEEPDASTAGRQGHAGPTAAAAAAVAEEQLLSTAVAWPAVPAQASGVAGHEGGTRQHPDAAAQAAMQDADVVKSGGDSPAAPAAGLPAAQDAAGGGHPSAVHHATPSGPLPGVSTPPVALERHPSRADAVVPTQGEPDAAPEPYSTTPSGDAAASTAHISLDGRRAAVNTALEVACWKQWDLDEDDVAGGVRAVGGALCGW